MSNTSVPMHPVSSSNLSYVGWQDGTLYVTFRRTGKTYRYEGVPEEEFNYLKDSTSPGTYLNTDIIPNYTAKEV